MRGEGHKRGEETSNKRVTQKGYFRRERRNEKGKMRIHKGRVLPMERRLMKKEETERREGES